jgi:hypothetical protein
MNRYYVEFSPGTPHAHIISTDDPGMWTDGKRLTRAEGANRLKEQSRAELLKMLKPGDTVRCILRHVSRSGMYRVIDFYAIVDGEERYLSGHMKNVGIGEEPRGGRDGIGVGGCGMDMGFACVYELGRVLWPKGTEKPHGTRNGEPDSDGGYALKHRWI